jgi:hypothetical protein
MSQFLKTNTKNAFFFITMFAVMMVVSAMSTQVVAQVSGAIFTSNSTCDGTNINIYASKDFVYLDGGPRHPGAAGLPDGSYYVQVTTPDGTVLGTSVGSNNEKPVSVVGGEFQVCYQLSAILIKASDETQGYDDTTNNGGEYKVWVSMDGSFTNSQSKTDNFKVKGSPEDPPPTATLHVRKFYDANANGMNDDGQLITGWLVRIQDGIDYTRSTPVNMIVDPDDYIVTEFLPIETNWQATTNNPVAVTLLAGDDRTVEFGNLCLGAGGGHTLGYWSNNNGKRTMDDNGGNASELALLTALNLRDANGNNFNPGSYNSFRTWLLSANATNMAYMLSAQLAAMELNVEAGWVSNSALVYAPGTGSANPLGYDTIGNIRAKANASLGTDGYTVASGATRSYQEALKNALDRGNNNLNFVQAAPCAFTFAP